MSTDSKQEKKTEKMKIIISKAYLFKISPPNFCYAESLMGRFGWHSFTTNDHVPYIMRNGVKFCAVRMIEKIISPYLSSINHNIYYECVNIQSYSVVEVEQRLLNEINSFHCDFQFGRNAFTIRDVLVRLDDGIEFYNFLVFCNNRLSGKSDSSDKCGYIAIDKQSTVPYVTNNEEKYVPLFYFEGTDDLLQLNSTMMQGWNFSYLKFCYKVQGLRDEYVKQDKCAVATLTQIKKYFPENTTFEEFWPSVDEVLRHYPAYKNNTLIWFRPPSLQVMLT